MAAKKQTFEEALEKLEAIVSQMEAEDTGLEDCVKLYKDGLKLALFCSERLSAAEETVALLQETAAGIAEKPFMTGEGFQ